jgi:hypothetical protein
VAPRADEARRPGAPIDLDSSPEMVLSRRPRRRARGGWLKVVIGLVVFVTLAGAVAGGVLLLVRSLPRDDDGDNPAAQEAQGNFAFTLPPGWRKDKDIRLRMQVPIALTRRKQRSHMALAYRDYKTREPSEAELLDVALTKLRGYFTSVEYEDPFQGKQRGRTGTLGGEPAIVVDFQGTDKSEVIMRGQAYLLGRQGFGYWLFTWGPEDMVDQLAEDWDAVRSRFRLFNQREGWKPRPPESLRFVVPNLDVQLNYLKGLWRREDNPKDYDDQAVLALRGFEPTEDEATGKKRVVAYAGKAATVQVLALPAVADVKSAYEAALEHVKKKQMDTYPMLAVKAVNDRKTGKPVVGVEVGALRGQWARLQLELDPDTSRFGLLAVVNLPPKGSLAVFCECRWERRDFWDQEFRQLIETVRQAPGAR